MQYKSPDDLPLVLTVTDLADVLSIGRNTAYNLVRSGRVKSVRIGMQYRISKTALLDYLEHTAA